MKLTDYVVQFLKKEGINAVFGYQGGAITHLVDSIYREKDIKYVQTYHEQAAAFAAESYSRVTGNLGVAIATSGPGATNLITGIGSSYFDSIPCLYITGQVNLYEYKRSDKIRQNGFQETDIVDIVKPITKYAKMIKKPEKIKYELEMAIYIAKSGRPGPVLIDIPMNIQRAEIDLDKLESYSDSEEYINLSNNKSKEIDIDTVKEIVHILDKSKRPVIVAGGGIRLSNANKELIEFSQITDIPIVSTMMGLDAVGHDFENYVGFMGVYGNRYSNLAVANCDCLIVLGSRLTSRQTSTIYDSFAREAIIIHIDIDMNELKRNIKEDISLIGDLKVILNKLNSYFIKNNLKYNFQRWKNKIREYKNAFPSYPTQKKHNKIDPNEFMNYLSKVIKKNSIICLDVGQSQIWACQSLNINENQRIITSGGMGAMGFSLPAGIGAYYAKKNSQIIVIAGDGGIQMNIQELETVVREKIPIKIIIMNNRALGMIRHFQEMYFDSRYYGTIEDYSSPEFTKIGKAYGISSVKIDSEKSINQIEKCLNNNDACIIDIQLSNITYVIPKLSMGRPIEDQTPLLSRDEFNEEMIVEPYNKE